MSEQQCPDVETCEYDVDREHINEYCCKPKRGNDLHNFIGWVSCYYYRKKREVKKKPRQWLKNVEKKAEETN